MRRLQLFEIHESRWCPPSLRDAVTDTVRFYTEWAKPFAAIEGRLAQALVRAGQDRVVDLCSGAGGPWPSMIAGIEARTGTPCRVTLTDLHPNRRTGAAVTEPGVQLRRDSIDARSVPAGLRGVRTLFSSLHHFAPADARRILQDGAAQGPGVAVFEAQSRTLASLLFFLLYLPLTLAVVPLVRPFRLSRLVWTYAIPLLPLVITFDALVSCLRTYDVEELGRLADEAFGEGMSVDVGRVRAGFSPLVVTFLIAVPDVDPAPRDP